MKWIKNLDLVNNTNEEVNKMLRKVAILANGGDVSGFNAVIRAIVKTAEENGI